jgi:hypothetical protein
VKQLLFLGFAALVTLVGWVAVGDTPANAVAAATTPPLSCSPTNNLFLESVCSAGSRNGWRTITVAPDEIGPTVPMYARFARAVANADATICEDDQALLFIQIGSRLGRIEAQAMCERYIGERISAGWFEVADPSTGEVVRIEVAK